MAVVRQSSPSESELLLEQEMVVDAECSRLPLSLQLVLLVEQLLMQINNLVFWTQVGILQ
jgi:hypothetical protein